MSRPTSVGKVIARLSKRDHSVQSASSARSHWSPNSMPTPRLMLEGKSMDVRTGGLPVGSEAATMASSAALPVGRWVKVASPS